jgi:type III pantothenate kinase
MTESTIKIGRNTVTSMNNGFLFGFAAMTEGLCERLKQHLPGPVFVVGTGGAALELSQICAAFHAVKTDLILEGLRLLYTENCIQH